MKTVSGLEYEELIARIGEMAAAGKVVRVYNTGKFPDGKLAIHPILAKNQANSP